MQGDNGMQREKRYLTEAQEWYFRLMNDPNQFEEDRFIDNISVYSSVIEEFQNYMKKQLHLIVLPVLESSVE